GKAVHLDDECWEADLIVGADGAGSVVRQSLEALKCCQSVTEPLGHAYKELELPPLEGRHALDPAALHIWPRGGEMAIALPNPDGTFTGTLFFANETFERLQNEVEARKHLETHYRSMLEHVPNFEEQWSSNPVGFLGTLRVDQWHHGNTVLIGDAAHAIVPFYGQGMNAAFEDVRRLDELHAAGVDNLPEVLFQERKPNADAIAEMALMNFVEMRDHVGDPMFLNRKALERKLGRWIPKMFTPLYDRVSFSNQPYADALRHGKRQDQLLRRLQSLGLGR
ncbi:MAG: FAD-dependent monooxygenase, partial [Planctomycetota bacterium]|nr:FAD-dependent monooxygenase [Planctomycetota bacterium]